MVGDIDAATLAKLLDLTFGALPKGGDAPSLPPAKLAAGPSLTVIARDIPQSVIMFADQGILRSDPAFIASLLAIACAATVVLHVLAYVLFRRTGVATAYGAALLSGNRNMGLMLVVTAGTAGEAFSLYVGIAQIPMYCAPLVLTPFLRRSRRRAAQARP